MWESFLNNLITEFVPLPTLDIIVCWYPRELGDQLLIVLGDHTSQRRYFLDTSYFFFDHFLYDTTIFLSEVFDYAF